MGAIDVEGLGSVQIAGDAPTREEATRMMEALRLLTTPDEPVIMQAGVPEFLGGGPAPEPFMVREPSGQLKIPLGKITDADPSFNIGRAVAKGFRDLITGVVTFPFDVAGEEQIAGTIRKHIPDIETSGTPEDVAATVTQFGVPGAVAAKAATRGATAIGLGAGQETLAAGVGAGLARFGAQIAAASGADILAANPDDVQTIGNMFPELLVPTGIKPTDSDIQKRIKLGVEAGTITAATTATLGGALLLWKGITAIIRPLVATDKAAEEIAARAYREMATNPENAIENINAAVEEAQGTAFKPTTGTASRDPGLIGAERGLAGQPEFVERRLENQAVASREFGEGVGPTDLEAEQTRRFFENEDLEARMVETQIIGSTEAQIRTAQTEIDNIADELNSFRSLETEASLDIDQAVMGELERLTLEKNRRFNIIDPGRSVIVDPQANLAGHKSLHDTLVDITTKKSALDSTPGKLPPVVKRLKKAVVPKENAKTPLEPISFGALEDTRADLSAAIKQARVNNEGGVVESLLILRGALDRQAVILSESGGAAAERAAQAIAFFKDIFAPRFRQGVGKGVARAQARGAPVAPSALAGRFITGTKAGALEAGEDLRRIIQGIDDPSLANSAVRNFTLSRLAQTAVVDGKFRPDRIDKFLDTHSDTLQSFPGVRQEIQQLKGRTVDAVEKLSTLEESLSAAQKVATTSQRERDKAVTALFIGSEPEAAINRVMGRPDPAQAMRQLVTDTARDETGQATQGLRVALSRWIDNKVKSTTLNPQTDDFMLVANEVEKLFKNPRTRGAIEVLYTPEEIKIMGRARDMLRQMNRINLQVTGNSSTTPLAQSADQIRIVLASFYGIVKGRGIFAISRWVQNRLGKDPVAAANAVLKNLALDPQLAKIALAPDTRAGQKVVGPLLQSYVANNVIAEVVGEKQEPLPRFQPRPRASEVVR